MPPEDDVTILLASTLIPVLLIIVSFVNCGGKKNAKVDDKVAKDPGAKPPKSSKQEKDLHSGAEGTGSKQKKVVEDNDKKKKKDKKGDGEEGDGDPFEGGIDGDDGATTPGDKTEGSQKASAKPKKKPGKGGKTPLPNKDGYDDLGPGAPPGEPTPGKSKLQNTDDTKSKIKKEKQEGGDDGYDNVDPTKNVNREDGTIENGPKGDAAGKKKAATPGAAAAEASPPPPVNQPRKLPRDAKQQAIAKGAKKGKGDYPTFDDVLSDWDSKKEGEEKAKAAPKKPVKPAAVKQTKTTEVSSGKEEQFALKSNAKTVTEKTQQGSEFKPNLPA